MTKQELISDLLNALKNYQPRYKKGRKVPSAECENFYRRREMRWRRELGQVRNLASHLRYRSIISSWRSISRQDRAFLVEALNESCGRVPSDDLQLLAALRRLGVRKQLLATAVTMVRS